MSERPETPEEIAKAEAISFNHFYKMNPDLNITANTYLLRSTAAELGLDLVTTADIQYVAGYLGNALARIKPEPIAQPEPPSYEERLRDHNERMSAADPRTIQKLVLVESLAKRGYTRSQIEGELMTRGYTPLSQEDLNLLNPPTQEQAVDNSEYDQACAHIGRLLGRGPVTARDIKNLSADETRKLLWPNGSGTPINRQNESAIDLILRGK